MKLLADWLLAMPPSKVEMLAMIQLQIRDQI